MTPVDFLTRAMRLAGAAPAMVWRDVATTHGEMAAAVDEWALRLDRQVGAGDVVALEADFSPMAVAGFLALAAAGCILVPFVRGSREHARTLQGIAECEWSVELDARDQVELGPTGRTATHDLYRELRRREHPGLVLFSSGTSGEPKGAVHDLSLLLEKFETRRPALRTLSFLLFDHIGGINTMLHTLANGGCLVTVDDRSPDSVAAAIARHRVEVLPTSPTFLNLLLLSQAHHRHDLSALRMITYGTEPMPESTLRLLHQELPGVRLRQTYGLAELGILRASSAADDSLWMRVGGEGFETRVVDGLLQIRARSAMLGYLNADSPFTDDGWFMTGDLVDVDGEYIRVRGRASEMINVGGSKVHPAEVESVIREMDDVAEVTVEGEANPLVGMVVTATVRPREGADRQTLAARVKVYCRPRMEKYKVPVRVSLTDENLYGERFKKVRRAPAQAP